MFVWFSQAGGQAQKKQNGNSDDEVTSDTWLVRRAELDALLRAGYGVRTRSLARIDWGLPVVQWVNNTLGNIVDYINCPKSMELINEIIRTHQNAPSKTVALFITRVVLPCVIQRSSLSPALVDALVNSITV